MLTFVGGVRSYTSHGETGGCIHADCALNVRVANIQILIIMLQLVQFNYRCTSSYDGHHII